MQVMQKIFGQNDVKATIRQSQSRNASLERRNRLLELTVNDRSCRNINHRGRAIDCDDLQ